MRLVMLQLKPLHEHMPGRLAHANKPNPAVALAICPSDFAVGLNGNQGPRKATAQVKEIILGDGLGNWNTDTTLTDIESLGPEVRYLTKKGTVMATLLGARILVSTFPSPARKASAVGECNVGSIKRVSATSAAPNGVPSENWTPSRSVKVMVRPSWLSLQALASSGSGCCVSRLMRISTPAVRYRTVSDESLHQEWVEGLGVGTDTEP